MKILDRCVIYTADDEEPDCGVCDNQDCGLCDQCGSTGWWHYYEREEQNSKISRLIIDLEKLSLKNHKKDLSKR